MCCHLFILFKVTKLKLVFLFWEGDSTFQGTQNLLLALCSSIIPGGAWRTFGMQGFKPTLAMYWPCVSQEWCTIFLTCKIPYFYIYPFHILQFYFKKYGQNKWLWLSLLVFIVLNFFYYTLYMQSLWKGQENLGIY